MRGQASAFRRARAQRSARFVNTNGREFGNTNGRELWRISAKQNQSFGKTI